MIACTNGDVDAQHAMATCLITDDVISDLLLDVNVVEKDHGKLHLLMRLAGPKLHRSTGFTCAARGRCTIHKEEERGTDVAELKLNPPNDATRGVMMTIQQHFTSNDGCNSDDESRFCECGDFFHRSACKRTHIGADGQCMKRGRGTRKVTNTQLAAASRVRTAMALVVCMCALQVCNHTVNMHMSACMECTEYHGWSGQHACRLEGPGCVNVLVLIP
jgi:hypothetical protein